MSDAGDSSPPTKIEPSSPYYVGPNDKPGDYITDVRLNLSNFDEWSYSVRTALKARRKYGFLNGTITDPKPPCTADDWETVQALLVSWLNRTIEPEVKALLPNFENAKELWDAIHERFNVIDGPRIQQIKSSLYDCRQRDTMSVSTYYGKLCQLWDELDKFEPIIACKCRKCECNIAQQFIDRRDSDRLHQFLLGLISARFGHLRSVLLTQSPLPSHQRAFHLLSQEEQVQGKDRAVEADTTAISSFSVRTDVRPHPSSQLPRTERQQLLCNHCNRRGHDRSMCFDLLGELPDWWYDLKGIKKPTRGGSGRGGSGGSGRGGGRVGTGRGGGRTGAGRGEGNKGESNSNSFEPNTLVHATTVSDTPKDEVTVYGTPNHTSTEPSYESGDWSG